MIDRLKQELAGLPCNFVVGVIVPTKLYKKVNLEMLRILSAQKGFVGSYVCVNSSFGTVQKNLKKGKVGSDNLFFIDCVSKAIGRKVVDADNCVYLNSPESLTDLSIAIHSFIEHTKKKQKFVYIDSLSALRIHNDQEKVVRFVHYLSGKMRLWGMQGVMLALHEDLDRELIAQIGLFCDKVIDLR